LSSDNGYNGYAIPRCYDDHTQLREEPVTFGDKSSSHTLPLFHQSTIQKLTTPIRLAEKEYQHVFAPPGKVGVAIDVVDGNPIVHKVKSGSPLEGLLKPKDLVIAIDDVDTTKMSAADVTHLMVKRMNYRRKITFVRKDS
jgi:C-terminal processing protease CtpA/Prc